LVWLKCYIPIVDKSSKWFQIFCGGKKSKVQLQHDNGKTVNHKGKQLQDRWQLFFQFIPINSNQFDSIWNQPWLSFIAKQTINELHNDYKWKTKIFINIKISCSIHRDSNDNKTDAHKENSMKNYETKEIRKKTQREKKKRKMIKN